MRSEIAALLFLVTLVSSPLLLCSAWMTGSKVSSFGGSVLVFERQQQQIHNVATIEMKKGKDNVPPAMRSQYAKQKELVAMRDQMVASSKPGADGFPVFNLYIRTKRANVR